MLLALPFVVGIAALRGLTVALPIFHGSDELVYQLPTIRQFAAQLPFPDLGHYVAAQTPLFHLLLAYLGKAIGYQLWRLRLVEVLISYALALAVFALLHERLRLRLLPALAMSLLFVLSPYIFGTSFRVLTDNLATLFVVLAIERLERYRETGRLLPFALGCASIAAGVLTRQSTAFMLPVAALYALRGDRPASARVMALVLVALAAAPAGALFVSWHGLVPPGGDPSSCALCPAGRAGSGTTRGALEVQTPELTLATIGLYGTVLFAPAMLLRERRYRRERPPMQPRRSTLLVQLRGPVAAALVGVLLLLLWPATPGAHAAGLLWNASKRVPSIDGTSLLFWILVPLSGAVLYLRIRAAPRRWLPIVFLGCFLVAALVIRYPWQKYVDPFVLLGLLFTIRPDELTSSGELTGAAVLAVAFVAYTLSFVS